MELSIGIFLVATYRCSAKENATETLHCTHPVRATDVEDGSKVTYRIVTGPDVSFILNRKCQVSYERDFDNQSRLQHMTTNQHTCDISLYHIFTRKYVLFTCVIQARTPCMYQSELHISKAVSL